jgi:DNA primase
VETGHEPLHHSKSGRCVVINATEGTWYCRSCRKGGDAASFLMQHRGATYKVAVAYLRDRYGTAERPVLRVEVRP